MSKTERIIDIMRLSGIVTVGLKSVANDNNDFLPIMEKWAHAYVNHDHDAEQEYLSILSDMISVALKNNGDVIL
jgi:hypothetical protein